MTRPTIGLLHPGSMGSSIGRAATTGGLDVLWASEHRSRETCERAEKDGLSDVIKVVKLARTSDIVLSVCPPHAAIDVAETVIQAGFKGIYADLNALSPETARGVSQIIMESGADYVDGSIIGPPARSEGSTRLYLSGFRAQELNSLFAGSPLAVVVMNGNGVEASALKMAYASWTKGTTALLLAVRALAVAEGVEDELMSEWDVSQKGLRDRSEKAAEGTTEKAWRFVGEMNEIAATYDSAGLPDGFHYAAATVYERMSKFRGVEATMQEILSALYEEQGNG
jgi:3-hydroxyisobutyrate dehydrogenase-like beta-hydroxyacid dehydrogenase